MDKTDIVDTQSYTKDTLNKIISVYDDKNIQSITDLVAYYKEQNCSICANIFGNILTHTKNLLNQYKNKNEKEMTLTKRILADLYCDAAIFCYGFDSFVEKLYLIAIAYNSHIAMNNLAIKYDNQEKYDLAEKFYLMAVCNYNYDAMNKLGLLYIKQKKYESAEKILLMAFDEHIDTCYNLVLLYENLDKKDLIEKYCKLALYDGHIKCAEKLATLYKSQGNNIEADKYYSIHNNHIKKEEYENMNE